MERAWRFSHPDFDSATAGLHVSATGGVQMIDEQAAIRQAVLLLLSTTPGERVMRPAYGCNLHRLLFWPNDNTTAGLAIHYVRQAIERWEPRVEIVKLDAARSAEAPSHLAIELEYRVRATQKIDRVQMSLSLNDAGAAS
jgi:hypothetical protein